MSRVSTWSDVLGPFYSEAYIERNGIDKEGLIGLTTGDGDVVYPHAQFDRQGDEIVGRREQVITLWSELIVPAIDEGVVDEWTATGLLLQSTPGNPSAAEQITEDPTLLVATEQMITNAIWRFRQ